MGIAAVDKTIVVWQSHTGRAFLERRTATSSLVRCAAFATSRRSRSEVRPTAEATRADPGRAEDVERVAKY